MLRRSLGAFALAAALAAGCAAPLGGLLGGGPDGAKASVFVGGAFPKGFLWGVATSGFQSEGGDTHHNWVSWEQRGKFPERIGKSVDFWNRYPEDMDLAKGMNLNAFRMSVEWSRIEPRPGQYDRAALDHYVAMIDAAVSRGLEPVVTLNHFVYPAWLDEGGGPSGWERPEAPEKFAAFAKLVAGALRGKVRTWITINEPNVLSVGGFASGQIPPGRVGYGAYKRAVNGMVAGHRAAYRALHDVDPASRVSTNVFYYYTKGPQKYDPSQLWGVDSPVVTGDPASKADLDWPAREQLEFPGPYIEDFSLEYLDYIAIDYYWGMAAKTMFNVRKAYNWSVSPDMLDDACLDLWKKYRKPILIAENGLATEDLANRRDGWNREAFLVHHLYYLRQAISQGVSVMGYMHWSLTDNYEIGDYSPRFGLYSVDVRKDPSLKRVPTSAVAVYREIAGANALPTKLVWTYMGLGR
jgi:beta-glucosidase